MQIIGDGPTKEQFTQDPARYVGFLAKTLSIDPSQIDVRVLSSRNSTQNINIPISIDDRAYEMPADHVLLNPQQARADFSLMRRLSAESNARATSLYFPEGQPPFMAMTFDVEGPMALDAFGQQIPSKFVIAWINPRTMKMSNDLFVSLDQNGRNQILVPVAGKEFNADVRAAITSATARAGSLDTITVNGFDSEIDAWKLSDGRHYMQCENPGRAQLKPGTALIYDSKQPEGSRLSLGGGWGPQSRIEHINLKDGKFTVRTPQVNGAPILHDVTLLSTNKEHFGFRIEKR